MKTINANIDFIVGRLLYRGVEVIKTPTAVDGVPFYSAVAPRWVQKVRSGLKDLKFWAGMGQEDRRPKKRGGPALTRADVAGLWATSGVTPLWWLAIGGRTEERTGQPFHTVSPSPLPILMALLFFFGAIHMIYAVRGPAESRVGLHFLWPLLFLAVIMAWMHEVYTEERLGHHTREVQQGFRLGIVLFIASEAMLFLSFFWGFFHVSLNPSIWVGAAFPPEGVVVFDWWRIPLLNTLILLSSGISLTLAHKLVGIQMRHERANRLMFVGTALTTLARQRRLSAAGIEKSSRLVMVKNTKTWPQYTPVPRSYIFKQTVPIFSTERVRDLRLNVVSGQHLFPSLWILDTALRGIVFLGFQSVEYIKSLFTITNSAYGAVFFSLTGLHGIHVFIGAVALLICGFWTWTPRPVDLPLRVDLKSSNLNPFWWGHRVAFEGAAWYWHFVDVVWLLVFLFVYWWAWAPDKVALVVEMGY